MTPRNLNKDQFKEMLDRYVKGQSLPDEERFIEQWYNALGTDQVQMDEASHQEIEDKLWNAISHRISQQKIEPVVAEVPSRSMDYRMVACIAAVLVIGLSALFFWPSSEPVEQPIEVASVQPQELLLTSEAQPRIIGLEDGTRVTLKPNSRLRLKNFTDLPNREVYLEGEAFFEVAHDKEHPFFVYTGEITTKVLGTSFTVSARDLKKAIEVSVKTGRVSVTKTQQKSSSPLHTLTEEIILTPNQKAIYDGHNVVASLVEKPKRIIKEGVAQPLMQFDDEPAANILNAIDEAYGVELVFDEEQLSKCRLTTTLSNEDLYDRLSIICKAINGTYELYGTQIVIRSKGCQPNPNDK